MRAEFLLGDAGKPEKVASSAAKPLGWPRGQARCGNLLFPQHAQWLPGGQHRYARCPLASLAWASQKGLHGPLHFFPDFARSARLVWLTQQDRGGDHDSGNYRARFWARQRPTRASLAAVGQV